MGEVVRIEHHQVRLEWHRRVGARRSDDIGTEGQVRNELAVHHIPLDSIHSGVLECPHFLAEPREVGGQNRRRNVYRSCHDVSLQNLVSASLDQTCDVCGKFPYAEAMHSEQHDVRVEKLVAGGEGLARLADGRVVFVPAVIDGEDVSITVVQKKNDFARATLASVRGASPSRREPPCPHVARGCGGCDWQHMAPSHQLVAKAAIVSEAFARTAKIEVEVPEAVALPAEARRTTIRVAAGSDGFPGFRAPESHDLVVTDSCLVAHESLSALMATQLFEAEGEATFRVSTHTGEVGGWCHEGRLLAGTTESIRKGEKARLIEQVCGHEFQVSMGSFFQSSPSAAELIVDTVAAGLDALGARGGTLVDAYGGIGLFSKCFAGWFDELVLLESNRLACRDAITNLADCAATVIECNVEHWRASRANVVIADPSRAGLGKAGVRALLGAAASVIVLVSCDAVAAARDAQLIVHNGYNLQYVSALDLFPETHHVEVVSVFVRG